MKAAARRPRPRWARHLLSTGVLRRWPGQAALPRCPRAACWRGPHPPRPRVRLASAERTRLVCTFLIKRKTDGRLRRSPPRRAGTGRHSGPAVASAPRLLPAALPPPSASPARALRRRSDSALRQPPTDWCGPRGRSCQPGGPEASGSALQPHARGPAHARCPPAAHGPHLSRRASTGGGPPRRGLTMGAVRSQGGRGRREGASPEADYVAPFSLSHSMAVRRSRSQTAAGSSPGPRAPGRPWEGRGCRGRVHLRTQGLLRAGSCRRRPHGPKVCPVSAALSPASLLGCLALDGVCRAG